MRMASSQEPMNATPHHSKVKVSLSFADTIFVAGTHVSGKMEMECRADKGLGIGVMMVELFAVQELCSRDHSATSVFLYSKRLFQGPNLPPSNAVQAHPIPGFPVLPMHYHQARRGRSTFLFRIPIPESSPSAINFGSGLAKVRYELRASVGVFWKGERRLVTDNRALDVVAAYPYEETFGGKEPQGVVVGENGKFWMQGTLIGGVVVAGGTACVELQVKNHSTKKNTSLTLSLSRMLVLPGSTGQAKQPLRISDTLTVVPFRGAEYIIPPGSEGVASLVFDVPKEARGVRGGTLDGDETEPPRITESLFEVRCSVEIKIAMEFGSKDILLDIPVTFVHPLAIPPPDHPLYPSPAAAYSYTSPIPDASIHPDFTNQAYSALPVSPPPLQCLSYVDQNQVWLPPSLPLSITPQPLTHPYPYFSPQIQQAPYFGPSPPIPNAPVHAHVYTPRPLSAGANASVPQAPLPGLVNVPLSGAEFEPEEGKGERALRIATHLRLSSRHRSVSPQSHRYPLPPPPSHVEAPPIKHLRSLPPPPLLLPQNNLFVSPPASEGMVHSPRPQLTPKHSFTIDPITHHTLPKSERVEQLERMADAVVQQSNDLSGDLPKTDGVLLSNRTNGTHDDLDVDINKTLPGPPVPAEKPMSNVYNLSSPSAPTSTRADANFSPPPSQPPESMLLLPSDEKTPPTPTLMAVHPTRYPRTNDLLGAGCGESGLDALERRLLMEVGTRKLDPRHNNDKRTDARSAVMPIAIPTKSPEPLNDSAISSLTLAGGEYQDQDQDHEHEPEPDHDSDADVEAKTHRGGRSSGSGEDRGRSAGNVTDGSRGAHARGRPEALSRAEERLFLKDNNAKAEKKGRKKKASDKVRSKTAAKGRVAAWLGGIDPDVPPQEEEVIPPSPSVARAPSDPAEPRNLFDIFGIEPAVGQTSTAISPQAEQDVSSAPNPRSSGFMPLATLKRDAAQRHLVTKEMSVVEEARRVASLWSFASPAVKENTADVPVTLPSQPPMQSVRTYRNVSPPSEVTAVLKTHGYATPEGHPVCPPVRNVWRLPDPTAKAEVDVPPAVPPKKSPQRSPRLPAFPSLATQNKDPEVKYDIRSARGGRGGKVAAVASIWASAAANNNTAGGSKPKVLRDGVTSPPAKPVRSPGKHVTPPRLASVVEPKPQSPVPLTSRKAPRAPRKLQSATGLSTAPGPITNVRSKSSDALVPKRVDQSPTTKVFRSPGHLTPTNLSSPALSTTEPMIKSSSVPAVISPSHATPMLSSTASLARPRPGGVLKVEPAHRAPTLGLGPPSTMPSQTRGPPAKPTGPGDLAFGQARLRDLIKKYQGQGG